MGPGGLRKGGLLLLKTHHHAHIAEEGSNQLGACTGQAWPAAERGEVRDGAYLHGVEGQGWEGREETRQRDYTHRRAKGRRVSKGRAPGGFHLRRQVHNDAEWRSELWGWPAWLQLLHGVETSPGLGPVLR